MARRMRWLSPGEGACLAAEGEVGQPHPLEEGEPGLDLLEDLLAIWAWVSVRVRWSTKYRASVTDWWQKVSMSIPPR